MPKRKRGASDDGDGESRKSGVREHIARSRKLLNRALKTAKGFERQKFGKRLTLAKTNGQSDVMKRINREIEVLKTLDLEKVGEAQLYKCLLKIKTFRESEDLPEEVRREVWKPEGDEEVVAAVRNAVSGMLNMKAVKEVLDQSICGMYLALGISAPVVVKKGNDKGKDLKGILKNPEIGVARREVSDELEDGDGVKGKTVNGEHHGRGYDESSFEGFGSEDEEDAQSDSDSANEEVSDGESLDEDTLAHYDALVGASSDEERFDEEEYKRKYPAHPTGPLSLSLSPTPSLSKSPSPSVSPSESREPESKPSSHSTKPPKGKPVPIKAGSTFLPTLMGGYWSGSEESASDLEDDRPTKKNRKGQMARRAIAEKKYGERANHIKSGKGPVSQMKGKGKDDGWDPKRGAKDSNVREAKFGGRDRGRGHAGLNVVSRGTNENALPVDPRKRGMGRKDDVGVLHPSWQAAKKAKELKKTAKFEGKKVVFD